MTETFTLEFDGGSRGNPGPAGIGVVVRAADGTAVVTLGRFIGRATNNVAEYRALIIALQQALALGARKIVVRGDSELVIKQMRGEYRVKNVDLRQLYEEAQHRLKEFTSVKFEHNLRGKNELADKLANMAMDKRAEVTEVDESPLEAPVEAETKSGDAVVCPRCGCTVQVIRPSNLRPHQLRPFICQCGAKMDRSDR